MNLEDHFQLKKDNFIDFAIKSYVKDKWMSFIQIRSKEELNKQLEYVIVINNK